MGQVLRKTATRPLRPFHDPSFNTRKFISNINVKTKIKKCEVDALISHFEEQFSDELILDSVPGLPVLIVAVSLAVTGTKKYAASNCWLTLERGLIYWAFVGPVAVVIFVSMHLPENGSFFQNICLLDQLLRVIEERKYPEKCLER